MDTCSRNSADECKAQTEHASIIPALTENICISHSQTNKRSQTKITYRIGKYIQTWGVGADCKVLCPLVVLFS